MMRSLQMVTVVFVLAPGIVFAQASCQDLISDVTASLAHDLAEVTSVGGENAATFMLVSSAQSSSAYASNAEDLLFLRPLIAQQHRDGALRYIDSKLAMLSKLLASEGESASIATRGNKDVNLAVAASSLRKHVREAEAVINSCLKSN